jgi:TatD DNase family protein
MRLFDSHTHIQEKEFESDRQAAFERARAAGVAGQLVLGVDVASSEKAIALAETHDDVYAAAGCHPHNASEMEDASLGRLAELAGTANVVVVGEIGLDFYRDLSPREKQVEVLRRQLETAAEVSKPVAVHCRDAQQALLPIIEEWSMRLGGRLADGRALGVMHYFAGDVHLAHRYVELGFLISIHTSVTYPKAQRLQEIARELPLDVLVIETDSPYGPPQSQRGKRNEPAYVIEAAAKIAELRGVEIDVVAEATTENALRLLAVAEAATAVASSGAEQQG